MHTASKERNHQNKEIAPQLHQLFIFIYLSMLYSTSAEGL